jgi:hypothetical protein
MGSKISLNAKPEFFNDIYNSNSSMIQIKHNNSSIKLKMIYRLSHSIKLPYDTNDQYS